MVFKLGFLGFLESIEHILGEKITVVVGTSKYFDTFGDDVIPDTDHGSFTGGTENGLVFWKEVFGGDGVNIFGNFQRGKISEQWGKEMPTTIKAFVN